MRAMTLGAKIALICKHFGLELPYAGLDDDVVIR